MSETPRPDNRSLVLLAQRLEWDRVCEHFETAWLAGQKKNTIVIASSTFAVKNAHNRRRGM